ncbi:MAG TPA: rhodanese-like domain-containing protein [Acidimicrobiales bacterium]|jgi:rhodanese-related sulfurtransferase|nr:rhodanese-like domain-containing protein [Acidimicrobiales bacterium]
MTPAELDARRAEVQIVDVRWPNEWEAGRIDGALHVPQDELDDRLDELDNALPLVTVCRTGSRSSAAAAQLRAEGFRAENLDGGLEAWASVGLPLVTADGQPGAVVEPEPPPDDRPIEHQRIQAEMMSVLFDLQDRFGDREPTDEEVREFLRQRLLDEGRTPEEADRFMAGIDEPS